MSGVLTLYGSDFVAVDRAVAEFSQGVPVSRLVVAGPDDVKRVPSVVYPSLFGPQLGVVHVSDVRFLPDVVQMLSSPGCTAVLHVDSLSAKNRRLVEQVGDVMSCDPPRSASALAREVWAFAAELGVEADDASVAAVVSACGRDVFAARNAVRAAHVLGVRLSADCVQFVVPPRSDETWKVASQVWSAGPLALVGWDSQVDAVLVSTWLANRAWGCAAFRAGLSAAQAGVASSHVVSCRECQGSPGQVVALVQAAADARRRRDALWLAASET